MIVGWGSGWWLVLPENKEAFVLAAEHFVYEGCVIQSSTMPPPLVILTLRSQLEQAQRVHLGDR